MSESKHTPGPWTVDGPPYNQIVWSSAENRVCFLAHSNGLDDERDIANGRLIAAAPDLLEALTRLTIDCIIAGLHEQAGFDCWIEMAKKAIAKAEGRFVTPSSTTGEVA